MYTFYSLGATDTVCYLWVQLDFDRPLIKSPDYVSYNLIISLLFATSYQSNYLDNYHSWFIILKCRNEVEFLHVNLHNNQVFLPAMYALKNVFFNQL